MSFSHKAFAFDGHAFEVQLAPTLRHALAQGDTSALQAFIDTHWELLKDPYEGEPLSPDWRAQLEAGDVRSSPTLRSPVTTTRRRTSGSARSGVAWAWN